MDNTLVKAINSHVLPQQRFTPADLEEEGCEPGYATFLGIQMLMSTNCLLLDRNYVSNSV